MRSLTDLLCFQVITFFITLLTCVRFTFAAYNEVKYAFKYSVEAPLYNVITHHWEERHGGHTRGAYGLLDPDGKVRLVEYQVEGQKGFQAVVRYRNPTGPPLRGHLSYPWQYRKPVLLAKPVSIITPDILKSLRPYPYLNGY